MNNKAFTLVELLGVFLIILIMFVFITPIVTNVINKSSNTTYESQIDTILSAAYDFTLKDLSRLPSENETSYLTLGELKTLGLIDINITNPKTKNKFPDDLVIAIKNVGLGYKNKNKLAKVESEYLYYIKEDVDKSKIPTIKVLGLEKNSDGNYILNVNLNDEYREENIKAVSYNGIDLSNKVKKYITLNDITVDEIDTSKNNIYKINYVVVDEDGNPASSIVNIIISDNEAPAIELPTNNKISSDVESFDLLEGIICTDNSGTCNISYSGEIKYKVKGKYIIEYKGVDPSGNTKIQKRVITIE